MSNDPDDRSDEPKNDHWLSTLLSALERLEHEGGRLSGRRRGTRLSVNYDISVGSDRDLANDESSRTSRPTDSGSVSDRPRRHRHRRSTSHSHHLTTQTYDDELVVTADVAGVDPEAITVGFDDSTLVVAVSGTELDRVDVPWEDRTADASLKNGVLTVTVRSEAEGHQ